MYLSCASLLWSTKRTNSNSSNKMRLSIKDPCLIDIQLISKPKLLQTYVSYTSYFRILQRQLMQILPMKPLPSHQFKTGITTLPPLTQFIIPCPAPFRHIIANSSLTLLSLFFISRNNRDEKVTMRITLKSPRAASLHNIYK